MLRGGNFYATVLSIYMDPTRKGPVSTVEDATLVKLAQEGSEEAFAELVRRNQKVVYSVCWKFLGDAQDAADCAQEAFLRAYRGLKSFRGEANFSTWIHRIAVRTCLNRIESPWHRLRKRIVSARAGDGSPEPAARLADRQSSPAREFAREERAVLVREAIRSLPDEQRAVVVLRDIEGYQYDEISAMLRVSIGTVKSRLSRAREALYNRLKGVCEHDL